VPASAFDHAADRSAEKDPVFAESAASADEGNGGNGGDESAGIAAHSSTSATTDSAAVVQTAKDSSSAGNTPSGNRRSSRHPARHRRGRHAAGKHRQSNSERTISGAVRGNVAGTEGAGYSSTQDAAQTGEAVHSSNSVRTEKPSQSNQAPLPTPPAVIVTHPLPQTAPGEQKSPVQHEHAGTENPHGHVSRTVHDDENIFVDTERKGGQG